MACVKGGRKEEKERCCMLDEEEKQNLLFNHVEKTKITRVGKTGPRVDPWGPATRLAQTQIRPVYINGSRPQTQDNL